MKFRITYSHDRVMHGAIAGLSGGIIQSIFAYVEKMLHFTDRTFIEYGEILILGQHKPLEGQLLGLISHLVNTAFWGIAFSYIMKYGQKKYYVSKGIGLGLLIWLLYTSIGSLFKLPLFNVVEPNVGYFLLVDAAIYGIIMSLTYRYLDNKLLDDPGSLEGFQ
ncbi:hypothetical protein REC12_11720 [Desulfosporosinus sp. PR]|uniref:DUF6789 family protein n=1 Tax=Candidatus Desulfosporosinus nitrosoreducens TaxID=3401928 RepID=UPI0027FBA1D8|nr:DUF6789 family protein [Desulfosporosinus sp. PR]MDQ7094258.1 hypothetical protein [Desulfosporosinus sp. PR]